MIPRAGPRQVQELFDAVVDMSPEQRLQYLDEHGPDPAVRRRVEDLLAADAAVRAHSPDESPPSAIGSYRVVRELGRGTYGVVYLAHDDTCDRPVAIKVAHHEVIRAAGGIQLCLNEARALARLDHPHIVRIYEAKPDGDGSYFIVSQYIEGQDLAHRLAQGRPSLTEAVRLVATLADALQHLHEKGIYHRDIKPANILLDSSGRPHLADFGLSLNEEEIGQGPHCLGTPAYMSPEQASEEGHHVDGRTDIFSLGVIFFETLTGKPPFRAESRERLRDLIVKVDAPAARQKDRTIPAELDRICAKALARRKQDRYASAGALAEDLIAWLATHTAAGASQAVTARLIGALIRMGRRGRRRPLVPGMTMAIVLAVLWFRLSQSGREAGSSGPPPPPENQMVIGIWHWVGYAPLKVAEKLRLCEPELILKTKNYGGGVKEAQNDLGREINATACIVDAHVHTSKHITDAKVVLKLDVSLGADGIVATKEIQSLKDLRDRPVSYVQHEPPHFLLLALCKKHGLSLEDFTGLKGVGSAKEAAQLFINNQVDAAVTWEPYLSWAADFDGRGKFLESSKDVAGEIVDILCIHKPYLEAHPNEVRALIRGWFQAVEKLERGDREAIAIAEEWVAEGQGSARYQDMVKGMRYSNVADNVKFFGGQDKGPTEFRRLMTRAQDRWNMELRGGARLNEDPKKSDGSSLLLGMSGRLLQRYGNAPNDTKPGE